MEAVATGDMEKAGKSFLKLGEEMANLATLPESAAANAAMEMAKGAMKLAGGALGMQDQPWMKKAMESISLASNFTSLGNAAEFMGTEVLAVATGGSSQIVDTAKDIAG
ncbi:hypothetical protein IMCC9480_3049 [Oxalobacteraceae bacterium IMCC9480]|nr:hypothetical protein IMCC9480_3049 [Oxalobacteraceae bacterium IMCC9480]